MGEANPSIVPLWRGSGGGFAFQHPSLSSPVLLGALRFTQPTELPLTPLLLLRVNVLVVMVEESMSSLNVALIALLTPTPVALLAGLVELTVGDVVSTS